MLRVWVSFEVVSSLDGFRIGVLKRSVIRTSVLRSNVLRTNILRTNVLWTSALRISVLRTNAETASVLRTSVLVPRACFFKTRVGILCRETHVGSFIIK